MADNPVLPSYIIPNQPDPAAAVRSNVELAMGLAQAQRQQQTFQMAQQLHNAQLQAEQQKIAGTDLMRQQDTDYQQQMLTLKQKPGGPTSDDIIAMSQTPTGLRHAEALNQNIAKLEEKEKFGLIQQGNKVYNAIDRGEIGIAKKELLTGVDAYKNSGQMQYSNMWKGLADTLDKDPAAVKLQLGSTLNTLDPKFTENYSKQKGAENILEGEKLDTLTKKDTLDNAERVRAQELATKAAAEKSSLATTARENQTIAQQKILNPIEVDAKKQDLLQKQRDYQSLPAPVFKRVSELSDNIIAADRDTNVAKNLSSRMDQLDSAGWSAKVGEYWKNVTGGEDVRSVLRKQLAQFNNKDLLTMFPPGGRLNEEIIHQMSKGIFDPTSNPQAVKQVIDTIAARRSADATIGRAEQEWQRVNRGDVKALEDTTIAGIPVKKGESYPRFVNNFLLPTIPQVAGGSQLESMSFKPTLQDIGKARGAYHGTFKNPDLRKALGKHFKDAGVDLDG